MNPGIGIEILEFGSKNQIQSIGLRYEILRKPLGLFFEPDDLKSESDEIHIGAISGTEVVGCLLLKPTDNKIIKMRQVAVLDSVQGTGIGREMVKFCEDYCAYEGFEKIELHARESAVNFYLNLDYKKVGNVFEEVGIAHFKMEKIV